MNNVTRENNISVIFQEENFTARKIAAKKKILRWSKIVRFFSSEISFSL